MITGTICRRFVVAAAMLAFTSAASAGTVDILTANATLTVLGSDTYSLTGYGGSVDLTLDGPSVNNTIFAFATITGSATGSFTLPLTLNSSSMSLPVTFDGTQLIANGPLTFALSGNTVSVQLTTVPFAISSGAITADFRLSSNTVPEPSGAAVMGSGLLLLAVRILQRRRRA